MTLKDVIRDAIKLLMRKKDAIICPFCYLGRSLILLVFKKSFPCLYYKQQYVRFCWVSWGVIYLQHMLKHRYIRVGFAS